MGGNGMWCVMKVATFTVMLLWGCLSRADLFVSSFNNGRVYWFTERTGQFISTFGGLLSLPHGLAFGPDGNLYVASAGNDAVLRYNRTNGQFIDVFIPTGTGLDYPVWLEFRGDSLYVSSQLNNQVLRYNATNGAFISALVSSNSNGGLNGPSGMTWGPDGHLYVVGRFGNHVMRYDGTNGTFLGAFVPAGGGGLAQPFGCQFGPDGNLYVVGGNNNRVLRFHGTTGALLGDFTTNGVAFPIGLAFGSDTNLYVASFSDNRVVKFNGLTGALIGDFVIAGAAGLSGPNFMLFHDFGPPGIDSIRRAGTNVIIRWRWRPDTRLEGTASLSQPQWETVPSGDGRATNGIFGPGRFYRLVRD
jgi:DNA-binding beta-propeller fold protein YncE